MALKKIQNLGKTMRRVLENGQKDTAEPVSMAF